MNSRERVLAALHRQEPDRVPILEWVIHPKVIEGIYPHCSYADFIERMDLDAICTTAVYNHTVLDEEKKIVIDEWGITQAFTTEELPLPIKGPIQSEEDLERYTPPDSSALHRLGQLPDLVRRFKGEKAIAFRSRDCFLYPMMLRGLDKLLMDFILNPTLAKNLIKISADYHIELAKRAIDAGAEIIMLGDDYAGKTGPFMSPAHFEEFILPDLTRVVQAIKNHGGYCVKHCDGNIWPIIDMLVETGIDAINPLEPIAGMDIGEVKGKYGHRVCVIGNIDCGEILSQASVEDVIEAVKDCIAKASLGGGHIMSSSNTIHSAVRPENYKAMVDATKKYGKQRGRKF